MFAAFAKPYIVKSVNLSLMTLAENREVLDCSWAVDWHKMTSAGWRDRDPWFSDEVSPEYENMFWGEQVIVSPLLQGHDFKADGNRLAVCRAVEKEWNALVVKGWKVDTIADVGEVYDVEKISTAMDSASDRGIRSGWIKLAGGPWADSHHHDSVRFHRAIMAQPQDTDQLDQLEANPAHVVRDELQGPLPQGEVHGTRSLRLYQLKRLWANHRFFVTSRGHFGLGPAQAKSGDRVCVLFGCRVPVILHEWPKLSFKFLDQVDYYTFVGQAYVEHLMHYEGDLELDVESKKIEVEEFLLH